MKTIPNTGENWRNKQQYREIGVGDTQTDKNIWAEFWISKRKNREGKSKKENIQKMQLVNNRSAQPVYPLSIYKQNKWCRVL